MIKLQLFEKQMGRREFLGHIGALMLAVVGVSGVIKFFLNRDEHYSAPAQVSGQGYGGQAYGG